MLCRICCVVVLCSIVCCVLFIVADVTYSHHQARRHELATLVTIDIVLCCVVCCWCCCVGCVLCCVCERTQVSLSARIIDKVASLITLVY